MDKHFVKGNIMELKVYVFCVDGDSKDTYGTVVIIARTYGEAFEMLPDSAKMSNWLKCEVDGESLTESKMVYFDKG